MRELKLYHWGSYLLPGGIFAVYIGGLWIHFCTSGLTDVFAQESQFTPFISITIYAMFVGLVSYVAGMLLWGIAYSREEWCLWFPGGPYGWKEFGTKMKPHYRGRIEVFTDTLKKISLDETLLSRYSEVNMTSYRRFQEKLILSTEVFKEYLGPRIKSQWESLGTLLTLSLTFRVMSLIGIVGSVLEIIKMRSQNDTPETLAVHVLIVGAPVCFALLSCLAVIGFKYRNTNLGRDVAYAVNLINEKAVPWLEKKQ